MQLLLPKKEAKTPKKHHIIFFFLNLFWGKQAKKKVENISDTINRAKLRIHGPQKSITRIKHKKVYIRSRDISSFHYFDNKMALGDHIDY